MQHSTPNDDETTVAELRRNMAAFVAERDWRQFHTPKNITMAMAVEAAELMEHFQWMDSEASRHIASDPDKLAAVAEEIADVVGYALAIANELGIDLSQTIRAKMVKNVQKYPASQFRGTLSRGEDGQPIG
jgi:NTP pyrophosphatase (non-canonical NTP hydrolase)